MLVGVDLISLCGAEKGKNFLCAFQEADFSSNISITGNIFASFYSGIVLGFISDGTGLPGAYQNHVNVTIANNLILVRRPHALPQPPPACTVTVLAAPSKQPMVRSMPTLLAAPAPPLQRPIVTRVLSESS